MENNNSVTLAYIASVVKILIYGSSSLFTKKLLNSTDILDVISLRFLITAMIFVVLNFFGVVKLTLKGKRIKNLLLCSIFEPILYFVFETIGISMSTTIIVGVITALTPISSIIVARIFLKEKTNIVQTAFLLIGIIGVLIIVVFTNNSGDSSDGSVWGIVFMVLAILSGSMFLVFSRKSSKQFSSVEISNFSAFVGCISFNSVNVVRHISAGTISAYFKPLLSVVNIIGFAFLSILSSVVAVSLSNYAVSRIQISRVSAFCGISTVYTIILGLVFNDEILHFYHIVGTIMILVSVYGVNKFTGLKHIKIQTQ